MGVNEEAYLKMVDRYRDSMNKVIDQLQMTLNVFDEGVIGIAEAKRKTKEAAEWIIERN